MKRNAKRSKGIELRMCTEAARQIRQHARSSMKTEVCGVLIGSELDGVTTVDAGIQGANSVQGGAHVTFTQDTWEHIYQIKDRDYPDERIVGWYHSHPGFGVFLSDHDTFIHKNFFSAPQQVAWVYDPHSDEEGCFGWAGESVERLERIVLFDNKGGEMAGETGKPEPLLMHAEEEDSQIALAGPSAQTDSQELMSMGLTILCYLSMLIIGFLTSWFFFPRLVPVPVDPRTGQVIYGMPGAVTNGSQSGPVQDSATPTPASPATKGKP